MSRKTDSQTRPSRSCVRKQQKKSKKMTLKPQLKKQIISRCRPDDKSDGISIHPTPEQLPDKYKRANLDYIEHMRYYQGRTYYKVHFESESHLEPLYLHRFNGIDLRQLIRNFKNRNGTSESGHLDEIEWEVQSIESSRKNDNGHWEYLVKWKYWIGDSTWLPEDSCNCINLIALYENPKLRRMMDYPASNRKLWIESEQMDLMIKVLTRKNLQATVLMSTEHTCYDWPKRVQDGLNIGCTRYDQHWFVVIIVNNSLGVSKKVLIADSCNTLLVPRIAHHPIFLRLKEAFPEYAISPIRMTPMDRQDMCGFFSLAAIERVLFTFDSRAMFIPESINFNPARAEYLRSVLAPETNGELALSLRSKEPSYTCPVCEFCRKNFDDHEQLDKHIVKRHFMKSEPGNQDNQITKSFPRQSLVKTERID